MAQIERKSDGNDVEDPPASFIPHKVFQHAYHQKRCPMAYTKAIKTRWTIHHPGLKKLIFLEKVSRSMT